MADETQTDATNSEATQTGDAATTDTNTSNTGTQTADQQAADDAAKADAGKGDDKGGADDGKGGKDDADPLASGDDGLAGKADGEDGDDGDKGENAELFGAPEGDYELTDLPEGFAVDKDALEAFTPTAKKLNLSNEGVKSLATEAYPIVEKQVTQAFVQQVVDQRKAWETASRTAIGGGKDAEGNAVAANKLYGGDNYDAVMSTAAKAIDRFTSDETGKQLMFPGAKEDGSEGTFRDFLRATGLSNHPAMVQFAYLAGKSISEDSDFSRSGDVPAATLSREEKYYGQSAAT